MVNYTPNLSANDNGHDKELNQQAKDVMTQASLTLTPEMNILEAAALIEARGVSGAPVLNASGLLIGFLSQKDCLKFILDIKYYNHGGGSVGDYMSKTLMSIDVNEGLLYIAELFIKNNFQMYPVLEEGGRFVGVITRANLYSKMVNLKQTNWRNAG